MMIKFLSVFILWAAYSSEIPSTLIHENGVGQLQLGMNYEKAKKAFPQFKYTIREGFDIEEDYYYRIVSITQKDRLLITFTLSENKEVVSISIFSPLFRTKEGIGVGSMISNLIQHYPDYILNYPGEPILAPKGSHLSFAFAPSPATAKFAEQNTDRHKYTGKDIPISSIRIGEILF